MKWRDWLKKWELSGIKIQPPFLEMEWSPSKTDQDAAWDLYIELLTRVATQPLLETEGDEKSALKSIYALFDITRSTLKYHGRGSQEFSKIAIIVLNQKVRPFTAKWHKAFEAAKSNNEGIDASAFRIELNKLQQDLKIYTAMLSEMAGVEDMTNLEGAGVR